MPAIKPCQSGRPKGGLLHLTPDWAAMKGLVGPAWAAFVPLARHCMPRGIKPGEVDDAVLSAMVQHGLDQGVNYAPELCQRVRRAVERLHARGITRGIPTVSPARKRRHPRQQQWATLSPILRSETEAWQGRPKAPAPAALISERNLLLRAIDSCERAGLVVKGLQDLAGEDAQIAILSDEQWFGSISQPSTTRSKYLEWAKNYARSVADKTIAEACDELIRALPRRHSRVSAEALEAAEVIAQPVTRHRIAAETAAAIEAFGRAPNRPRRKRAQDALAIRLVLNGSYSREELIAARFDGTSRIADGVERPILTIGDLDVESTASATTRALIDIYWSASVHLRMCPDRLIEHEAGKKRDDTTLSEGVRRFGRRIGLELTLTHIEIATVLMLVQIWRRDPEGLWTEDGIRGHLRIEQIANLRARYAPLFSDDIFQRFADQALRAAAGDR